METPLNIELVLVYKIDEDKPDLFTEKVYAKKVNDHYQIQSIPAFAKNIAYGDIVKVEFENGEFHFEDFIKESGHSVLHIVLFDLNTKGYIIKELTAFGCGVNSHVAENYLVVDVPAVVSYYGIKEFLYREISLGNIDLSESCLSNKHRPNDN